MSVFLVGWLVLSVGASMLFGAFAAFGSRG